MYINKYFLTYQDMNVMIIISQLCRVCSENSMTREKPFESGDADSKREKSVTCELVNR